MTPDTPDTPPDLLNVAERFRAHARAHPDQPACVVARGPGRGWWGRDRVRYRTMTFGQLEERSDALAAGLARAGFERGMKTVLLVRPGPTLFALTIALFKLGATLVLIDAGMGRRRLLDCLRDVQAEGFVGIPAAHVVRCCFRRRFRTLRALATAGRRFGWGGVTLAEAERVGRAALAGEPFAMAPSAPDERAAVLFTTGSTGPAKGVLYTHRLLDGELARLTDTFGIGPGDRDCATFPGFSLFSLFMGMTVVVPDMNPTRPGFVDPRRVVGPIRDWGCTFSFGSPALWRRVGDWCRARDVRLPTVTRIVMAGAPAGVDVHRTLLEHVLDPEDGADTWSPYGATEAMPVAVIRGSTILRETAARTEEGAGACLGYPVPLTEMAAIAIEDRPLADWTEVQCLPDGEIGELCVKGGQVTRMYYNRPEATRRAKIVERDAAGNETGFWHRMGDAGYRDAAGRWWFCGRVAHRVVTAREVLYTIPCEAVFNRHPSVARSALVGVPGPDGAGTMPAMVVELTPEARRHADYARLGGELLALGRANALTRSIEIIRFHPRFPTDIRHNVKIDREALAAWAAGSPPYKST